MVHGVSPYSRDSRLLSDNLGSKRCPLVCLLLLHPSEQEEFGLEVGAEVVPIYEVRVADIGGNSFPVVNTVSPFLGSALVHVGHGSLDFHLLVRELIQT
jgi:hypothetical protein